MKTIKTFCLFLCLPLLTACLDETPKGQLDEKQAYATASALYINAVASLYNYIGGSSASHHRRGHHPPPRRRLVRRRLLAAPLPPRMDG